MRRTKIVCTIGPACEDPKTLKQMLQAGMNVARLNLSHGNHYEHEKKIRNIRKISGEAAILADLQGPRIRTGYLKNKSVELKTGASLTLTSKAVLGDKSLISLSPGTVVSDIKKGNIILLSNGTIMLKVLVKKRGRIECKVLDGGVLGEHKGVNLPQTKLSLPSLTSKDKKDISWGVKQKVDYFALSFVREAEDILEVKKILKRKRAEIPVIAKLERPEAIQNLRKIIDVSDGIMVARGDLGVEISLEKVPTIQKKVIELCQKFGKPVIVATQMLESMVSEETPTRAEVSDVANAIFDGTDAVMLSEETSIGKFPVEALRTMGRIAKEAEKATIYQPAEIKTKENLDVAVAHAACVLTHVVNAKVIITFTETGSTALRVSKYRPQVPIYGIVTNDKTLRKLSLYYGVYPLKIGSFKYIDEMILNAEKVIQKSGQLKKSDLAVITAGIPVHIPGTTNLVKVHRVGEKLTL
jgi:pyruvate kinase